MQLISIHMNQIFKGILFSSQIRSSSYKTFIHMNRGYINCLFLEFSSVFFKKVCFCMFKDLFIKLQNNIYTYQNQKQN